MAAISSIINYCKNNKIVYADSSNIFITISNSDPYNQFLDKVSIRKLCFILICLKLIRDWGNFCLKNIHLVKENI